MVEECGKNCRSTARESIEWSLEFKQYVHCFKFCSRSLNSSIGRGSGLSLTKNLPESWVASQSLERPLSPSSKSLQGKGTFRLVTMPRILSVISFTIALVPRQLCSILPETPN